MKPSGSGDVSVMESKKGLRKGLKTAREEEAAGYSRA